MSVETTSDDEDRVVVRLLPASEAARYYRLAEVRPIYNVAQKFPQAILKTSEERGLLFMIDDPELKEYMRKHGHRPTKTEEKIMAEKIIKLSRKDAESLMLVPEITRRWSEILPREQTIYTAIRRGRAFPDAVYKLDGQTFVQTNHPQFKQYLELMELKRDEALSGRELSTGRGHPAAPGSTKEEIAEAMERRKRQLPFCKLPGCPNRVPRARAQYCSDEHYFQHGSMTGSFAARKLGKTKERYE